MSLKNKTIFGTIWNVVRTFVVSIVDFAVFAVLARYLSVAEFALLAFCLVLVEFANVLTTVGVNQNLIQRSKWELAYFKSVLTFILLLSTITSILLATVGGVISYNYYSQEAAAIVATLSILPVLMAMQSIYSAKLERDFKNKELTVIRTVASILSGMLTIALVFNGFGVWAIVFSKLLQHFLTLIIFVLRSKISFTLGLQKSHIEEIFQFCLPLFGIALLNFLQNKGSNLLAGGILGAEKFAFISVAKKGYDVLGQLTITSVNRMIVPSISRVEKDKKVYKFYEVLFFSTMFITPCFLGLGAISEEFITLAFGEKYKESAIYLTITTASIVGAMMGWYLPNLLVSGGYTAAALKLKLFGFLRVALVSLTTVWLGIEWMLIALTISTYLLMPFIVCFTKHYFDLSLVKMLKIIMPSVLASCFMISVIYGSKTFLLTDFTNEFVELFLLIVMGAAAYFVFLFIFFSKDLALVIHIFKVLKPKGA